MAEIGTNIERARELLQTGFLVGIPTETVYGLAGNALNPDAVAQIFETKKRPNFDPLIIHTSRLERVSEFVEEFPEPLKLLAEKFWPGPLTLLLPRKKNIPDLVTSGLETVAVRVPDHPLTNMLLESLPFPLAAPSANPFGYISPTKASHVNDQLGGKIPYILDGGPCKVGLESTIVGIESNQVVIYRLGGLEVSEIIAVVGPVDISDFSSSDPKSPGMLKSHYAPLKPFVIGELDELIKKYKSSGQSFAVLSFYKYIPHISKARQIVLSEAADPKEAAKNLFAAMRTLDSLDVSVILAELMPEQGLGKAINDRLKRAAAEKGGLFDETHE